ncbi:MAG: hypothetical protein UY31_C0008G0008 [Candidatus Wolfebacteria bacterium GW2011_GWE1_48_7]|uniref:Uncharacterized protein n=2 Tax=Candidatus Wolfeibacteriota TaxID=1752735 RepID=A0A0G1WII3_9BACT|nr:MAG: hypothetical protein UX70_C0001G0685 [Candidatus Wolfebacteria bacterium GW2011_GWB1_47_1]KKU37095.1 MAG: hypothetical protein UX49_C0002G0020 [Candidatus Wolfebacteria bacterium GW2011_GWC2_46_275]KKU54359.1 MAG: hypothetical protein UX76_C0003G0055 [Candidatus Wolfebacteria bacterium GW2011_GWC1_47_103]KKU59516.1 MAG: hypothetical protein UX83_C0004G0018 [Candidatus Wolfebacteria bacterium GW2011_GWE2_47_12]KKU73581.1 MAG: hypothetical protein UX96_C0003G0019 [Candidatus Wolfebacteria
MPRRIGEAFVIKSNAAAYLWGYPYPVQGRAERSTAPQQHPNLPHEHFVLGAG